MKRILIAAATTASIATAVGASAMAPWYYYNEANDRGCTQAYEIQSGFWVVEGWLAGDRVMTWGNVDKQAALDDCVAWAGGGVEL